MEDRRSPDLLALAPRSTRGGPEQLEPPPSRPGCRGDADRVVRRLDRNSPGRARRQPRLQFLDRVVLERLGPALQRPGHAAYDNDGRPPGHDRARHRGGPGGTVHGDGGLGPGRTAICGGATWRTSRWTTTWSCATGPRAGLDWIREVHSKIIQDKRPVVIIHDDTEEIDLPDTQDDPAFNDVYIVKGDTTNEIVLRRAQVPRPTRSWS